jgi:RNA polymerase sigma-70 factor (ECF subfamily)
VAPADDEAAFERLIGGLADDGPPPPDPLLRRLIARCRDLLPPRPRQALEARLVAGGAEPDPAIAARLGLKPNTFLQNFTRARRLLAECLERHGASLEEERP